MFQIATSLWPTDDPPLWTPLLTPAAKASPFLRHHNTCLSCGTAGHSLRMCPELCRNVFDLLNRSLVKDYAAWRSGQHRILDNRSSSRSRRDRNNRRYSPDNGTSGSINVNDTITVHRTLAHRHSIPLMVHAHLVLRLLCASALWPWLSAIGRTTGSPSSLLHIMPRRGAVRCRHERQPLSLTHLHQRRLRRGPLFIQSSPRWRIPRPGTVLTLPLWHKIMLRRVCIAPLHRSALIMILLHFCRFAARISFRPTCRSRDCHGAPCPYRCRGEG